MLPLASCLKFFAAALVLALTPGPDIFFVLTLSALHGPRPGLYVSAGLCTGLLVHTALVALGLAALIAASPCCFGVLKISGAGYLLYLAFCAARAKPEGVAALNGAQPSLTAFALYRRGLIMNLTNPKVLVFFLAFLPQFTRPEYGPLAPQILSLGLLFLVAAALLFGTVSLLAGTLGMQLQKRRGLQLWLNRAAAAIFTILAVNLLMAKIGVSL